MNEISRRVYILGMDIHTSLGYLRAMLDAGAVEIDLERMTKAMEALYQQIYDIDVMVRHEIDEPGIVDKTLQTIIDSKQAVLDDVEKILEDAQRVIDEEEEGAQ